MSGFGYSCEKKMSTASCSSWAAGDARVKRTAPSPRKTSVGSLAAHSNGTSSYKMPGLGDDCAINELLEGRMELDCVLPGNKLIKMTVERRTPMMDLLIQVTTANKINPSGHVIHVITDRGKDILQYKPNTPIGSLDTNTIHVVPKSSIIDHPAKRITKTMNQPFEPTFRLQVNLPRGQLMVLRVSPRTTLADVKHMVCSEKLLHQSKYQLVHPQRTDCVLDLNSTLAEFGANEISLMSNKSISDSIYHSTSDIMAYTREDSKKKGILGLFSSSKKKLKNQVPELEVSSNEVFYDRGISPGRSDSSGNQSSSSRLATKKRPAPPPPCVPNKKEPELSNENCDIVDGVKTAEPTVSHSRHSSDSSGYHEASVFSDFPESISPETSSGSGSGSSGLSSLECSSGSNCPAGLAVSQKKNIQPLNAHHRSKTNLSSVPAASRTSICSVTSVKKRRAPPPPTQNANSVSSSVPPDSEGSVSPDSGIESLLSPVGEVTSLETVKEHLLPLEVKEEEDESEDIQTEVKSFIREVCDSETQVTSEEKMEEMIPESVPELNPPDQTQEEEPRFVDKEESPDAEAPSVKNSEMVALTARLDQDITQQQILSRIEEAFSKVEAQAEALSNHTTDGFPDPPSPFRSAKETAEFSETAATESKVMAIEIEVDKCTEEESMPVEPESVSEEVDNLENDLDEHNVLETEKSICDNNEDSEKYDPEPSNIIEEKSLEVNNSKNVISETENNAAVNSEPDIVVVNVDIKNEEINIIQQCHEDVSQEIITNEEPKENEVEKTDIKEDNCSRTLETEENSTTPEPETPDSQLSPDRSILRLHSSPTPLQNFSIGCYKMPEAEDIYGIHEKGAPNREKNAKLLKTASFSVTSKEKLRLKEKYSSYGINDQLPWVIEEHKKSEKNDLDVGKDIVSSPGIKEVPKVEQKYFAWQKHLLETQNQQKKQQLLQEKQNETSLPTLAAIRMHVPDREASPENEAPRSQTLPRQKPVSPERVDICRQTNTLDRPVRVIKPVAPDISIASWSQRHSKTIMEEENKPVNALKSKFQSLENLSIAREAELMKQNSIKENLARRQPSETKKIKPNIDVKIKTFYRADSVDGSMMTSVNGSSPTDTNKINKNSVESKPAPQLPSVIAQKEAFEMHASVAANKGKMEFEKRPVSKPWLTTAKPFTPIVRSQSKEIKSPFLVTNMNGGSLHHDKERINVASKIEGILRSSAAYQEKMNRNANTQQPAQIEKVALTTKETVPAPKINNSVPIPPPMPPPMPTQKAAVDVVDGVKKTVKSGGSKEKVSARSQVDAKLDPREELMLEIRTFGGRRALRQVPVGQANWQLKVFGASATATL